MSFTEVERKQVWCIHFWDMTLFEGEVLGKEKDGFFIRLEGAVITDIIFVNSKNVFYNKEDAEKALFKAKLAGKKRTRKEE